MEDKSTYPGGKGDKEECPLHGTQTANQADRIGQLGHGRAQGRHARAQVLAYRHVVVVCSLVRVEALHGGVVVFVVAHG